MGESSTKEKELVLYGEKNGRDRNGSLRRGLFWLITLVFWSSVLIQMGLAHEGERLSLIFWAVTGYGAMYVASRLDLAWLDRQAFWIWLCIMGAGTLSREFSMLRSHILLGVEMVYAIYPMLHGLLLYAMKDMGWPGFAAALFSNVPVIISAVWLSDLKVLVMLLGPVVMLMVLICRNWFGVKKTSFFIMFSMLGSFIGTVTGIAYVRCGPQFLSKVEKATAFETDPRYSAYLGSVVRSALDGAVWWGKGTMAEPFAEADYHEVFAGITPQFELARMIHQLGWLPFLVLCIALLAVLIGLVLGLSRIDHPLGKVVGGGAFLSVLIQSVYNLLANLGCPLLYAAACPLLSVNSVSVVHMLALGMCLSMLGTMPKEAESECELPWDELGG